MNDYYDIIIIILVCDVLQGHDPDAIRGDQLVRLRERCIPLLCTLLHTVLHTRGLYRECLALADEIASEEFQLYKVLRSKEFKQIYFR